MSVAQFATGPMKHLCETIDNPARASDNGWGGAPLVARKILIIDDEDDIREVASLSLETVAGWEVVQASSGAQGVARAAEHKPDAILLDVMMPGMDGPTTFRELRKNPATASIPVLLLTAKVQGSDQRRFADLGVEAVLFKPFDPMTLPAQIAHALGWK
ncbi:MAG: response regulator [Terracidiphilus sp.]|jgi:CheY-like chemotaxis protein